MAPVLSDYQSEKPTYQSPQRRLLFTCSSQWLNGAINHLSLTWHELSVPYVSVLLLSVTDYNMNLEHAMMWIYFRKIRRLIFLLKHLVSVIEQLDHFLMWYTLCDINLSLLWPEIDESIRPYYYYYKIVKKIKNKEDYLHDRNIEETVWLGSSIVHT